MNTAEPILEVAKGRAPAGIRYYPNFVQDLELDVQEAWRSILAVEPDEDLRTNGIEGRAFNHGLNAPRIVEHMFRLVNDLRLLVHSANYAYVVHYEPNVGLGFHTDDEKTGEQVLGVTLGGPRVLRLRRSRSHRVKMYLEPGSAYVLENEARDWQHGILVHWTSPAHARKYMDVELFGDKTIPSVETLGITIRAV